jgi:AraC family transcriptional regulator of adaptative response/methylated-DNA-[protein]-cysteine methyltransferase
MANTDYQRVSELIDYLNGHSTEQPSLTDLAKQMGLSEFHLQRVFRRWAGVSPKRFLQYVTANHAKDLLDSSRALMDVAYDTGLSSSSRLHDLFVNIHAMTPAEYRQAGSGLKIQYGFHATPFGECLLATTEKGICWLSFVKPDSRETALAELAHEWYNSELIQDQKSTKSIAQSIFNRNNAEPVAPFQLNLKGTNFQIKVWEALLRIPIGSVASYEDVASQIGKPTAARAVGNAISHNIVAYLIPCHRVIRSTGIIGNYRWGTTRKQAMLAWESVDADMAQHAA